MISGSVVLGVFLVALIMAVVAFVSYILGESHGRDAEIKERAAQRERERGERFAIAAARANRRIDEIARQLKAAGLPVVAVVDGDTPLEQQPRTRTQDDTSPERW